MNKDENTARKLLNKDLIVHHGKKRVFITERVLIPAQKGAREEEIGVGEGAGDLVRVGAGR